jgi:hypothetical protein
MVTLIDVCVLTGSGLVGGICAGLLIRNKQIKNFRDELDFLENRYNDLVDTYTECIVEIHKLKFEKHLKPIPPVKKEATVVKNKPGRPKGSTNKPKVNGKPTTRKYTRKSSK